MELEPYLKRYGGESALTRLDSVLEFGSEMDAHDAERALSDMLKHPGYPGVAFKRSGLCFEVGLAAYAREGHLDYLDDLWLFCGFCHHGLSQRCQKRKDPTFQVGLLGNSINVEIV